MCGSPWKCVLSTAHAEPQPVVPHTAWSFWLCSTYIHMLYIYSVCRIPSTASKSKSSQHFQGDLTATPLRGFHWLVISEWNMPIQVIFIACTSCASWSISNCPCSIPQSAWGYATHTCAVLQIVLDTGLAFWKLRKAIKAPDICQVWPAILIKLKIIEVIRVERQLQVIQVGKAMGTLDLKPSRRTMWV